MNCVEINLTLSILDGSKKRFRLTFIHLEEARESVLECGWRTSKVAHNNVVNVILLIFRETSTRPHFAPIPNQSNSKHRGK